MADSAVFAADAEVNKGEMARLSSFIGAIAIADLVKTTLGPRGMDKILSSMTSGEVTITNDGATILSSLAVDNPAAKVLIDLAKTQDGEVGDGTTSVTVLCGELLREAEDLLKAKIHPMTVVDGWRIASSVAREALLASSVDNSADKDKFREDLLNIARTTLSSKLLTHEKDHFAELAVDAVMRVKEGESLEAIQVLKMAGGALKDSYLEEGFILNKRIGVGQPHRVEGAKIMVANTAMDTDKIKIFGSKVRVDGLDKVAAIEEAEREKMKAKVKAIAAHGCTTFINRQLIYDYSQELFADAGIMAIEHADFDGVERLAAVLGAEIVSTFDHPEDAILGTADVVEEIMIGETKMIRFKGVKAGNACTIVLRGASTHVLEEAERSLHDALAVLMETVKTGPVVYGGGASECLMAKAVEEKAHTIAGKKRLALDAFARALRTLPETVASNAGLDGPDLVTRIRAAQAAGDMRAGLDVRTGDVGDMSKLGVTEALKLKESVLLSASEAAIQLVRVDDIVKAAPRAPEDPHPHM